MQVVICMHRIFLCLSCSICLLLFKNLNKNNIYDIFVYVHDKHINTISFLTDKLFYLTGYF